MSSSVFGFDWKKSDSHWLLLTKFLSPQDQKYFLGMETWRFVLGEKTSQAIQRFVDEGLIGQANLENTLSCKYRLSELKNLSKKYGLPVSGKKIDLINRLLAADPVAMKKSVAGLTILQCLPKGKELAEKYLSIQDKKRDQVEAQVLDYIKQGMYRKACLAVGSFEAEQVFSRGLGIDWKKYKPDRDIDLLTLIFKNKPKILSGINEYDLNTLRIGASMMTLWGVNSAKKWIPPDLSLNLSFDNDTAARMVLFNANHKLEIAQYKDNSDVITAVEILTTQDSCNECKKFAGKKYSLNDVPELPHHKCTNKLGCRCTYIPVTKYF
jgi:hypothetical protein